MTLVQSRPRAAAQGTRRPAILRRSLAISLVVLGCWAAVLAVASPLSNDAVLRSTSPGNGETGRPERLLLTFDRPVPAGFVTVRMTDPYRRAVVLDRPRRVDGRSDTISVPMPRTRFAGTYAVAWSIPSSRLEPVGGTFTFDFVSRSKEPPAPQIDTDRSGVVVAFYTLAQFGAYAALAGLVGAVFFVTAIWPAGARRARRLIAYAWLGLVAATLAVLVSYGPYASWAPLDDAFDPGLLVATFQSETGAALLARLIVLALAGFGIAELVNAQPAETNRDRWLRGGGVLGGTAALAATWAFPGPDALGPLAVAVDIVHLTAMAGCLGGPAVLCAVPLRIRDRTELRAAVPRFLRVALVCLVVLVLTGGYQGWRQLGGLDAATTPYGWLFAGKLGLVLALAGIGVAGRSRLRGHDFRRLATIWVGVAGTILAVTALLVAIQPARTTWAGDRDTPPRLPAPARLAFDTGGPGGKGSLDLVVVPATVGENTLHISVLDGKNAPKDGITVQAVLERSGRRATSAPATDRELVPGHLVRTATFPARGEWELALTIRSAGGHRQTLTGVVDVG